MAKESDQFSFEISLSVLDHLGRNLYRSFITVLGEAISNSWDADAKNVWIVVDKENNFLVIKDDGDGMTAGDFQNKFLKIGYSKRKDGSTITKKGRPYIGRKGIGKLALLSCAKKISAISKTVKGDYVGGVIDNKDLDQAITDDLTPQQYHLDIVQDDNFEKYKENHTQGTIIYFENINEGIKNSIEHLKKLIALYFRFSLVDDSFNIFVNGRSVSLDDLKDLSDATEFVWKINGLEDPYIGRLSKLKSELINIGNVLKITGFIATVEKPRNLKISGTEEKIGIDLFVNGRLRERDILKHLPDFSTRHIASYLYGQIHFNELDQGEKDRFTSSREGVVPGDIKYGELIKTLKDKLLGEISTKWDELRLERGEDGDDENPRKSLQQRRALSLYNLSSKDYTNDKIDEISNWVKELQPDAEFNIPAYVDCFLSENLVRRYIEEKKIPLSKEAKGEIKTFKDKETQSKGQGNISIDIRKSASELSYLSMDGLANLVDKVKDRVQDAGLSRDANEYKPIRDALAHTSLLTDVAKDKLTTVYKNIKARVRTLLSVK
jgi:hypothetical protein